jgi:AcrR family transcriptional regulator
MTKGEETREAVLREALAQSSHRGLRGITIGGLADSMGMSKSGLFSHFGSKEGLQTAVMDYASDWFVRLVLHPALKTPRGEPRMRTLFERWLGWDGFSDYALPGGCIFVAVTTEFDDEPDSPVRDKVVQTQRDFLDAIETIFRTGIDEGHFRDDADPSQFAHELYSIMLGYHFAARLMKDPAAAGRARTAFEHLLDANRT